MKRPPPPAKTSVAGFTLIELLVVIIIAGVLAAIAAPGWAGFLNRQRINAVRSDLVATLKNTQQDAIQRRQGRRLQVDQTAEVPTVKIGPYEVDENSGDLNDTLLLAQTLGSDAKNITLTASFLGEVENASPQDPNGITFDYRGLPTEPEYLPFVIAIESESPGTKQCVIVANLLGSLKTANGSECDNPRVSIDDDDEND